ncbi:MAG: RluA family pseudouridine synthase [Actinobacteria bacterium]|nr:RluA family pseudouridine synthase [Actinomycetota bacterium]
MATSFTVPPEQDGARLDVVLADALGESRSAAAGRCARGEVSIGGSVVTKSYRAQAGEVVLVADAPEVETGGAGVPVPPIRYEDEHLLVVAKPAGLVVHPGAGHAAGTLVQVLADAGIPLAPAGDERRPGIVHRLDRETSGLLAVAKTAPAFEGLVALLQARDVRRRYLAVVEGAPPADRGRVEAPIGRDPKDRIRFACIPEGKPAVTGWQLLDTGTAPGLPDPGGRVSLLRCRLETGRTHQIRVHMSYAGCTVVGDRLYGARRDLTAALGAERFALHAEELGFVHPVTGEDVHVTEPPPEDLAALLERAGMEVPAPTPGAA